MRVCVQVVTLQGDVLSPGGTITAEATGKIRGALARGRVIEEEKQKLLELGRKIQFWIRRYILTDRKETASAA
jgi:chromosome segregation ATPase